MAPAGSYAALTAAIRAGAGSVYFGVGHLNMRSRAASPFTVDDLRRIARICRWCNVRSYLALNTLVYDDDLPTMHQLCDAAADAGISAVIATDISTIHYARQIGLEVHLSVQVNISNLEAVRFYAAYADTIVLARELSLEQIANICRAVREEPILGPSGRPVQIEIFVHGALCVAISGKCYMSLGVYNSSANRGACLQNCRRRYRVIDDETGDELLIDNHFVMSPRDLCTISELPRLLASGVRVLKIEGRGRTADYVATTVRVYREALETIESNTFSQEKAREWKQQLRQVYNRDFWEGGYYCGAPLGEWSASGHSRATIQRDQIGIVSNYYARAGIAEFQLKKPCLELGQEILIEGPTTGALRCTVDELRVDGLPARQATKDDIVTLPVPRRIRRNDKIFLHSLRNSPDTTA
jgi:putative protease